MKNETKLSLNTDIHPKRTLFLIVAKVFFNWIANI